MPHTKDNSLDFLITDTGKSGVWNVPYTFLFFFLIAFVWLVGQMIGMVYAASLNPDFADLTSAFLNGNTERVTRIGSNGDVLWMSALFGAILGTIAVILVIRLKSESNLKDYLGLYPPTFTGLVQWLLIFVLFMFAMEYAAKFSSAFETDFMTNIIKSSTNTFFLILSIGVLAPIIEELLFRGFLYRGIVEKWGIHAAVWIPAVIFAMIHNQYSWEIIISIVPMAAILGYSRAYTKSIWVPIFLHVFNNTLTTVLALYELQVVT